MVRFPARARELDEWIEPEASPVPLEEARRRPGRRARTPAPRQDSLARYAVTALALLLAVGALAVLLTQLGQAGRHVAPQPVPTAITGATTQPPLAGLQATTGQPPAAAAQPSGPPPPPPGRGPLRVTSRVVEPSYTVQSGDTLASIATKFGTSIEALQSINNLPDRNVLSVGQKLVIPNQD